MKTIHPWRLIWPVLATLVVPLIAAWFVYPGTHLPPKFGVFPPEFVVQQPPFWLPYFLLMLAVVIVIVAFLLLPGLFGFKPGPAAGPHCTAWVATNSPPPSTTVPSNGSSSSWPTP